MKSTASIAGHPLHPMLVDFPIGLFVFSLACDVIYRAGYSTAWQSAAYFAIGGGIIGALVAAVPGFIDLVTMPDKKAQNLGVWHMCTNLVMVVLFAVNMYLRAATGAGPGPLLVLSIVGVVLLIVAGGLGGSMVYVHGAAVGPPESGSGGGRVAA